MIKIKYVLAALIISVACFFLGKYTTPTKVEIKEVEKIVYRETKKKNTDKVITISPDGTKVTTIKTQTETNSELDKQSDKSNTIKNRPGYRINILYFPMVLNNEKEIYILDVQRNIFSELYIGVSISTQQNIGISLSLGF